MNAKQEAEPNMQGGVEQHFDATYSALIPKPRAARAERSVQTAQIEKVLRQSRPVLENMDDLIDNFADDNPDFVAQYKDLKPPSRPRHPEEPTPGS